MVSIQGPTCSDLTWKSLCKRLNAGEIKSRTNQWAEGMKRDFKKLTLFKVDLFNGWAQRWDRVEEGMSQTGDVYAEVGWSLNRNRANLFIRQMFNELLHCA